MKVNIGKFPVGHTQRRIDVRIDKFDTWGLDHTLALIILPSLIQLRDTKHGVPSEFVRAVGSDIDGNYSFDFIKDDEDKVFEKGCESWNDVMNKMIWSFQQIVDGEYDSQYHHGHIRIGWKKSESQFLNPLTGNMEDTIEMVDENPYEHWYDHVGHMKHEERIQEGLDLFGKYFRSLWD